MKKLILFLIVLIIGMPVAAKSIKQRITDLENKVALLARNEEQSWKELKRMNKEVTRLEEKEFEEELQEEPKKEKAHKKSKSKKCCHSKE